MTDWPIPYPTPGSVPEVPSPLPRHDLSATVDERMGRGRAARKLAPRRGLGDWQTGNRGQDPVDTLVSQNTIRVQDLLPLRHRRLAASPWNYFRGAVAVMAADLASRPDSGLEVQLCGDAHVLNFGVWATPEHHLDLDLRDFDETLPGPFEWDVLRLTTSLEVAAREAGIGSDRADTAVTAAVEAYADRMSHYAGLPELDIWNDGMQANDLVGYFQPADKGLVSVYVEKEKGHRHHRGRHPRLATAAHGRPRITADPPIRMTVGDDEQSEVVDHLVAGYRLTLHEDHRLLFDRFTKSDVVRQVVGVGSIGMRVYLVLFEGRSGNDPLVLQFKQAGPSAFEAHTRPAVESHHGARVIHGKRLAQGAPDVFLGWGSLRGNDYHVHQFRDMRVIPTVELIAPRFTEFATACGEVLARAHARTGDPVAIAAYIGKGAGFTEAAGRFARSYADQNDHDHAQLLGAIASGRVPSTID